MDLLAQLASVASSTLTSSSAAVPARMQLEPCPPQGAGHQPQLGPVMSGGFGGGFGGGFMAPPPFMVRPSSQLVTSGAECLVSMHASPSGPQQGVAGPGSGRRTRKRRAPAAFNDGAIAGFCNHPGCNKTAQGGTTRCKAHGGGRRCVAEGCTKSARGATDRCIAHGGGKVRAALLPPPLLPLLVPLPIALLTPPPLLAPRARSLACAPTPPRPPTHPPHAALHLRRLHQVRTGRDGAMQGARRRPPLHLPRLHTLGARCDGPLHCARRRQALRHPWLPQERPGGHGAMQGARRRSPLLLPRLHAQRAGCQGPLQGTRRWAAVRRRRVRQERTGELVEVRGPRRWPPLLRASVRQGCARRCNAALRRRAN